MRGRCLFWGVVENGIFDDIPNKVDVLKARKPRLTLPKILSISNCTQKPMRHMALSPDRYLVIFKTFGIFGVCAMPLFLERPKLIGFASIRTRQPHIFFDRWIVRP